jgi:hypothetical protein
MLVKINLAKYLLVKFRIAIFVEKFIKLKCLIMANYHVSKNKNSGSWSIQKEGGKKSSGSAGTQRDAEKLAKHFAGNTGGGEVRIHGLDGKIRDSDTVQPGNDPNPPKDTKH